MNPFPTPGRFQFVPPWVEIQTDIESGPFGIHFRWQDPDSLWGFFQVTNEGPIQRVQFGVNPPPEFIIIRDDSGGWRCLWDTYPRHGFSVPLWDDTYPASMRSHVWADLAPVFLGLAVGIFLACAGSKARQQLFGGDR